LTGFLYDLMTTQKWLTFYWATLYIGSINAGHSTQ